MPNRKSKRTTLFYYSLLAVSSVVYALLTFFSPVKPNAYNLSTTQVHLIQLTFVVPILLIWFLVVFGGVRFKNYALIIKDTKDGGGLNVVANSLLLIAFGGITSSLIALVGTYAGVDRSEGFVIFRNYLTLFIQVLSYGMLYVGASRLLKTTGTKGAESHRSLMPQLAMAGFIAVYAALMFVNPNRNNSPDPATISSFYLSDTWLLLTIIVPYAMAWSTATAALVNLRAYLQEVKGIIYRQAMQRLVLGFSIVVGFGILSGVLSSTSSMFVGASLKFILIFIYSILILYAAGFLVIASGARKLTRIEEV